jgi:hypothetical protein
LAAANIRRQRNHHLGWCGLPGADERPVMQDFNSELTDMSQFPGDKAGQLRAELDKFKLIRRQPHSDGDRRHAAFAVHH